MISYLSTPIESKVKPYSENIELISRIGEIKQNKYDNLLSTIFQKQNQLLDLDTLNEQVNAKKDSLLKQADEQLNKMASSDLTIPDNINKVENIFSPITSDSEILSDVYYTKQIRENQQFAQEALKKDPSVGNQINYNTSQQLVELYRKADPNQLSSSAPYATMFTPYIDVKTKKMEFLQKIGLIKDGYTNEFETTTIDGVKYYKKQSGVIPESEVLDKFNASLTSEDKQQLVLDGYHDYGNIDLKELMPELQKNQSLQLKSISTNLSNIDEVIKELDANSDGEVDVKDENINTKQLLLNSYLSQKNFYTQKGQMLKSRQEALDKFNANGDLVLGDRMKLFSDLKQDELAGDMVTLLSQTKPTEEVTKLDFTLAFNLQKDLAIEDAKAKSEKAKKEQENAEARGILKNYDYNSDGISDYSLGNDVSQSYTKITEDDLIEELGVENVENPTFLETINADGTRTPNKKDLSSYNIKNWKGVFDKLYKDKALNVKEVADKIMTQMSLNEDGSISEEALKKNKAAYTIYKEIYSKKNPAELKEALEKDPEAKKFEDLRQLELNLNNAGSIVDIHKQIKTYIKNKWEGNLKNVTISPNRILGFIEKSKKEQEKVDPDAFVYVKEYYNEIEKLNLIPLLNNALITNTDDYNTILEKLKKADKTAYNVNDKKFIEEKAITSIANIIAKNKKLLIDEGFLRREEEIQGIYQQLIDKQSFLVLTVSPTGEAGKKEPFYKSLNTVLNGAINNNRSDIKYIDENGKEQKKIPKDMVKPESFTTLSFNTGTGTIKALLPDLSSIEYTMTQQEGENNGLPFGVPSDDLIGKQLILETHLNTLKGSKQTTSKRIPIGKTPLGDASVYFDASDMKFKVSYYNKIEKIHVPISNISGSNTRETTMKFLQFLQDKGGDLSTIGNSSYNILNQ